MNTSSASRGGPFATESRTFEESHVDTENIKNKKVFFCSYLVDSIKNAARYIAGGIRTVFRGIHSFLISVCSPVGSCFRGEKNANPNPVKRDVSSKRLESHEQFVFTKPDSQGNEYPGILPGGVTLASNRQGIEGFINGQILEERYAVVNSIDASGELQQGVGCAIRELAGEDYALTTRLKQVDPFERLNYGDCATYIPAREGWEMPGISGDKNWQVIHNVLVPLADNPDFETHLKNSLRRVLLASVTSEIKYIILPLLGCGRAGGTGDRLAQAFFAATRDFNANYPYHSPPKMVLVGTDSPEDRQALAAFESKWRALYQQAASSQPVTEPGSPSWIHQPGVSTPSDISAGVVAEPVPLPSGVTPAASPSAGIPASAFSAGTDAVTWTDIGPAPQDDATRDEVAPDVRLPSARSLSQGAHKTRATQMGRKDLQSKDTDSVTLVPTGMKTFVMQQEKESKENDGFSYAVVSSVDQTGRLQKFVQDLVGEELGPLPDGPCVSCELDHMIRSGLDHFGTVYGMRLPPSDDSVNERLQLGENILDILIQAAEASIDRVFFPWSWDYAERSSRVTIAINDALFEFRKRYPLGEKMPPKVFLVGTDDDSNGRRRENFRDARVECDNKKPAGGARGRTHQTGSSDPSDPSPLAAVGATAAEAVTGPAARADQDDDRSDQHKVLITGLLEAAMRTDGGMFGYGRELSSKGKPFDLVNAANEYMSHCSGVAGQFAKDLGARFQAGTKAQADRFPDGIVPEGQCVTTESYDYASDPGFGLTGCRYIHSVVAPNKKNAPPEEYDDRFKESFVSVLLSAAEHGSDTVVSCFIGCAIFGGNGYDMARALHAAYQDDRIMRLEKVPRLILTGWNSNNPTIMDWTVYHAFVSTFETLNERNPIKLPYRG